VRLNNLNDLVLSVLTSDSLRGGPSGDPFPVGGKDFGTVQTGLGPIQLYNGYLSCFPAVKGPGPGLDHPPHIKGPWPGLDHPPHIKGPGPGLDHPPHIKGPGPGLDHPPHIKPRANKKILHLAFRPPQCKPTNANNSSESQQYNNSMATCFEPHWHIIMDCIVAPNNSLTIITIPSTQYLQHIQTIV